MANYAIVVGIDDYHERPLQGAVRDANAFASWLKESGQIKNATDIKLITSQDYPGKQDPPTNTEINRAVEALYNQIMSTPTKKANRLYFYFAGHGLGITLDNSALCLRPWTQFFNAFCISSRKYRDGLVQLDIADEIFFILDCCRDVDVLVPDPQGPLWNHPLLDTVNTKYVIISSTKYGGRSQEIEIKDSVTDLSLKRGAFTKFLLDALNGDAADPGGNIFISDLYGHLRNNFKSYTTTLRYVQEADINDNLAGANILVHQLSRAAPQYNFIITFQRSSNNVELQNGSFETERQGSVKPGDQWQLNLKKGIYILIDNDLPVNDPLKEKQIKNFNINSVGNEQF